MVGTIASLWSGSAIASAVICVPILTITARRLALVALAFTFRIAPAPARRTRAWVGAPALTGLLIPHKALLAMLWEAHALASKNVEILSSLALSNMAFSS